MTPLRFYLLLALALVIGIGATVFFLHYRQLQADAARGEQRGEVLVNASAGIADGTDIDKDKADRDAGLAAGRGKFQQAKQEAIRNEPETADRASRRVPDSVLNAFRERRLARERLGCAGRECSEDH